MFYTVRYLRPIQIYSRIKFRLYKPPIDRSTPPNIYTPDGHWKIPVQHKVSLLTQWEFCFLNEKHLLDSPADWDDPGISKLWRYNLHYFDDLNAVNADSRVDWHKELMAKWIRDNPPAIGTGWEPYPTSLRIVNWIKWALSGNELSQESIHSLAIQIRWLAQRLEFHILGNHLIANAKALIFAGLFFKGAEATSWLATGLNILKDEVTEQILSDGGHFERSPMYHQIVLEDLLDLVNITAAFPKLVPEKQLVEWRNTIDIMFYWLQSILHPDREIPFFNDAAFGIVVPFEELREYAVRLGINVDFNSESLINLPKSGYVRVENGVAVGLIDVAPIGPDYLPGHAHADTLSFELSLFGQRVFINSGVSQYGNNLVRQYQRSTIAHNTVGIDGYNSSEVWAGFRVARRAYPKHLEVEKLNSEIKVVCEHDGYTRLPGKCIHKREWIFKEKRLCIIDKITGTYKNAVANFYLHPDIKINEANELMGIFNLAVPSGNNFQVRIKNYDSTSLISSNWHPEFGLSVANKCISIDFSSPEISVSIIWE